MQEVAMGTDNEALDDDAIRIELRKLVEAFRSQYLAELAEVEVACKAEAGATEDQKQKVVSGLDGAKHRGEVRIQMMLDFIDRS